MPENYVEGSTVNCVLTFQGEYKAVSTCIFQPTQLFKYVSVHYNAWGLYNSSRLLQMWIGGEFSTLHCVKFSLILDVKEIVRVCDFLQSNGQYSRVIEREALLETIKIQKVTLFNHQQGFLILASLNSLCLYIVFSLWTLNILNVKWFLSKNK